MSNLNIKKAETFCLTDIEGNEKTLLLIDGQPLEAYFASEPSLVAPVEGNAAFIDGLLEQDFTKPVAGESVLIAFAPSNG